MFKLTTPKAVLLGFFLIAISIATLPITSGILIKDAHAAMDISDFKMFNNRLSEIARAIIMHCS